MHVKNGIFSNDYCLSDRYIQDYKELEELVQTIRKTFRYKIALTMGTFDMLHIGHARYLREAKLSADLLIVGVDSDEKVRKRKGLNRPVVPEGERIEMLAHLRYVDIITRKGAHDEKWLLIKTIRPDVLIISERMEYGPGEQQELESLCGKIVLLESQAATSTSAKVRKLHTEGISDATNKIRKLLDELDGGDQDA